MKTLTSTLMALALALLAAVPALAGSEQGDTVTKTFELTLHGDVPEDATFSVFYLSLDMPVDQALEELSQNPEKYFPSQQRVIQFCGPRLDVGLPTQQVSGEACKGGGTVYTYDVKFPRDSTLYFAYERSPADTPEGHEAFFGSDDGDGQPEAEDFEALEGDRTNSAWFRYDATGDDQQEMPEMPDTGSGGLAGASAPPTHAAAAGLSVLATGCYALARSRRIRSMPTPNAEKSRGMGSGSGDRQ